MLQCAGSLMVVVVVKAGGDGSGKEFPAQRWAFIHRGCRKNVKGVLFAERKIKNGFFSPPFYYTRRNTIHRYVPIYMYIYIYIKYVPLSTSRLYVYIIYILCSLNDDTVSIMCVGGSRGLVVKWRGYVGSPSTGYYVPQIRHIRIVLHDSSRPEPTYT